jgi:hypothetical protein
MSKAPVKDKVVVVTGAASGIGLGTVLLNPYYPRPPTFLFEKVYCPLKGVGVTIISIRRLMARPSTVSFDAKGRADP